MKGLGDCIESKHDGDADEQQARAEAPTRRPCQPRPCGLARRCHWASRRGAASLSRVVRCAGVVDPATFRFWRGALCHPLQMTCVAEETRRAALECGDGAARVGRALLAARAHETKVESSRGAATTGTAALPSAKRNENEHDDGPSSDQQQRFAGHESPNVRHERRVPAWRGGRVAQHKPVRCAAVTPCRCASARWRG